MSPRHGFNLPRSLSSSELAHAVNVTGKLAPCAQTSPLELVEAFFVDPLPERSQVVGSILSFQSFCLLCSSVSYLSVQAAGALGSARPPALDVLRSFGSVAVLSTASLTFPRLCGVVEGGVCVY